MGLPRIDTSFFRVAHADDPDVTPAEGRKGWVHEFTARDGATVLRVRALTGLELYSVPRDEEHGGRRWLIGLAKLGVHEDDRAAFDALPFQYQLGLGTVVLDASSGPPDPTSAPSSDG